MSSGAFPFSLLDSMSAYSHLHLKLSESTGLVARGTTDIRVIGPVECGRFLKNNKTDVVFFYPCFVSFMGLLGLKFRSDKLKAKQTQ
jgi:hypothetical protein